jgi:CheY-specific phosphatase CheX
MLLGQVFDEKIEECSLAMMKSYGKTLTYTAEKHGNRVQMDDHAAIIGYSGGGIPSGSITLWISSALLTQTISDDADLVDWLSELSNQLLGRILNQLQSYGIELNQSTPVVVNSDMLEIKFSGRHTKHYYFTDGPDNIQMVVFFDASFNPTYQVHCMPSESATLSEGESIIF